MATEPSDRRRSARKMNATLPNAQTTPLRRDENSVDVAAEKIGPWKDCALRAPSFEGPPTCSASRQVDGRLVQGGERPPRGSTRAYRATDGGISPAPCRRQLPPTRRPRHALRERNAMAACCRMPGRRLLLPYNWKYA